MPRKNKTMNKAISKLAEVTHSDLTDLTGDYEHDEGVRREESKPAAQTPMLTGVAPTEADIMAQSTPEQNYRRLVHDGIGTAPRLDDAVTAALLVAGMTASWAVNHWVIRFKDGRSATKRIGGRTVTRDRTAVGGSAGLAEWMHEINQLSVMNVFGDSTDR